MDMPGTIPTGSRSRHRVGSPAVFRPTSTEELCRLLATNPDTMIVGGGLDVVNRMKESEGFQSLILLQGVADLNRVMHTDDGMLYIGSMVSHDALSCDPLVREHLPELATAWERIANIRIRMQGTVGGNLCAGVPGYEAAVLLAALEAEAMIVDCDGIAAALPVSLGDGVPFVVPHSSCVTSVRLTTPPVGTQRRLLYHRSLRPALWLALAVDVDRQKQLVVKARVALGGLHAGPVVRELPISGVSLDAMPLIAVEVSQFVLGNLAPPTLMWRGTSNYRQRISPVLLSRLIAEAGI